MRLHSALILLLASCTSTAAPSRAVVRSPAQPVWAPPGFSETTDRAATVRDSEDRHVASPPVVETGFFEVTCACETWVPCRGRMEPTSLIGCASPTCPPPKLCTFTKDQFRCQFGSARPVASCKPSPCPTESEARSDGGQPTRTFP